MNLEVIRASAEQVAAEHAVSVEAHEAQSAAEAALLDAVVAAMRPALRALSGRIASSWRSWWPNNTQTQSASTDFPKLRGFRVAGDGCERDLPRSNAGDFEGSALYLMADGTWLELTYEGRWSKWQGASEEWSATPRPMTTAEVADEYRVEGIIENLAAALEKAKGSREKATARATERAEKLAAVVALLGGGR